MSGSTFYVYVGNGANKVSALRMSPETGELTKLQELHLNADAVAGDVRAGNFVGMALSPDNRFLYVSNRTAPYSIHTLAIDGANGTLTHLLESPTIDSAPFITTDRSGRFLLGAHNPPDRDRRTGFVSVAAISEFGVVLAPHQVLHTPPKMHSIMTDPSNRYAFAAANEGDMVVRYHFDVNTGLLNPDGLAPLYIRPKAGPRHHRYHPNGRFLYVNSSEDGTVYCYRYDARDGSTSEIQIISSHSEQMGKDAVTHPSDLRFTPDGKWLYMGLAKASSYAIFAVNAATGLLTLAGHCEVPQMPRGFNIDPFGRFLLHSGYKANVLVSYRINPATGELKKVAELASEQPNWVKIVRLP